MITKKKFDRIFKDISNYPYIRKYILKDLGGDVICLWCESVLNLHHHDNIDIIKARKLTAKVFRKKYMIK